MKRYERQLEALGEEGQEALANSTATVVGLGGLGSPAAIYLAAAGFGELILVDHDEVALSNLNRQILHGTGDLNRRKTSSGREKLKEFDPEIDLKTVELKLGEGSMEKLPETDLVLGTVDNFHTRYLLNEYAVRNGIPYIHGAVEGFQGQLSTVIPGESACLRCMFPEKTPEKAGIQVPGPTAGVVGTMMANEAIKYVTGTGNLATGRLILLDLKANEFDSIEVKSVPDCPICGHI